MFTKEEMIFLGVDKDGYEYYMTKEGHQYVYQFKNGVNLGWFCSVPTWERTLKNILVK